MKRIPVGILVLFAMCALTADWISPFDPLSSFEGRYRLPPWPIDGSMNEHWLGTDEVGRDVLSRLIHGSRLSIASGLAVALLAGAIGVILGSAAGWLRGYWESAILRTMDVLLALPSILLAIVVVSILGPNLANAVIASAVTALPGMTRIVWSAVTAESLKPYVLSGELYGASKWRIVAWDVLPNCLSPILVQLTFVFGEGILNVAALGFLGLGAQPPSPEWGTMLADARPFVESDPWLVTTPGLCILLVLVSFNVFGDQLRDRLDPRLRGRT